MAVTSKPLETRAPSRRAGMISSLARAIVYALALLALTVAVSRGMGWAQHTLDDLRYGVPRTVHLAGVVGGGDSPAAPTHVVALNLDGQVSIIVLPGGDASRLTTLPGPYIIGENGAAAVPLLALDDLTGDGAPDLLVTIRGETIVYVNHAGAFAPLTPEERARLATPGDAP